MKFRARASLGAASAIRVGDNGMVAFAVTETGAEGLFQAIHGHQAFNKNLDEFHKKAEFLHGNDERVVFLAQMRFHVLDGFPIHQFALGAVGAALGLGGFHGDFLELGFTVRACCGIRIFKGPFEDAMDNQIGITADWRGEMGVFAGCESEMAERFSGVACLFEGTEHEIGENALFGLSGDLRGKTLVMLRANIHLIGGKGDLHRARAATAFTAGRADAAVAHGNTALGEIFDAEGVTEGAGKLFEFENFLGVGLFVNAMERRDFAALEIGRDGFVCCEHELLDDAVGDVADAAGNSDHAAHSVEFDDRLGKIEINGTARVAAGVEDESESFHQAKIFFERDVTLAHFGIAFEDSVYVGVGHALDGTNHTRGEFGFEKLAVRVELQNSAHDQTVYLRIERADAVGKSFGKHGHSTIRKIDRGAAEARFAVEFGSAADVMSDVGDVDLQFEAAVGAARNVDGVVEILRGLAVNSDDGQVTKIAAARDVLGTDFRRNGARFGDDFRGENVRKVMLANDNFDVHPHFAVATENLEDAAYRRSAGARKAGKLDVHDGAIKFRESQAAARAPGISSQPEFFAKRRSQFVSRRDDDFVSNARLVRKDDVGLRAIAEKSHDGRIFPSGDFFDAAFEAAAGIAANNACENAVAMHGIAHGTGGDEEIAVHARDGVVRHHEAIAVAMSDQAAGDDAGVVAPEMTFALGSRGDVRRNGWSEFALGARACKAKLPMFFFNVTAML